MNTITDLLDEFISEINEAFDSLRELAEQIDSAVHACCADMKRKWIMQLWLQQSRNRAHKYRNRTHKNFVWHTSGFL